MRSSHVRCRLCGAIFTSWLPVPNMRHAALLMDHLSRCHLVTFIPLRRRMATEDLGTVAMEAFAQLGTTAPPGGRPCAP